MSRSACLFVAAVALGAQAAAPPRGKAPSPQQKLPDGVYAVRRDGLTNQEVLPLKGGEALAVYHRRYLDKGERGSRSSSSRAASTSSVWSKTSR